MCANVCPDANRFAALIGGLLTVAEVQELEEHLDRCTHCSELVAELAEVIDEQAEHESASEPNRVGRYRIVEQIGAGGMAVVYAARDVELGRKVALKLLRPDIGGGQRSAIRARLHREAVLLAGISHPNVLTVYEVGRAGERLFMAVELVDGKSMRDWVDESSPGWRRIVAAYLEAGRGLAAVHSAGLVHRDIKPDNILIRRNGHAVLADFGLATSGQGESLGSQECIAGDEPLMGITREGAVVGTPAYMAPEQLAGEPADARADQFALCAALFDSLNGAPPYAGDTLAQIADSASREAITTVARSIPSSLMAVVRRGLRSDPQQRFASVEVFVDELAKLIRPRRRATIGAVATVAAVVAAGTTALWLGARAPVASVPPDATLSSVALPVATRQPIVEASKLRTAAGQLRDDGDGNGCLNALDKAGRLDPDGTEKTSELYVRAICEMLAGRCADGKARYRSYLEGLGGRWDSAAIERMVKQTEKLRCPPAGPPTQRLERMLTQTWAVCNSPDYVPRPGLAAELRDLLEQTSGEAGFEAASQAIVVVKCLAKVGACADLDELLDVVYRRSRSSSFMTPAEIAQAAVEFRAGAHFENCPPP